MNNLVEKE
ncbi:hypothetical protein CAEBREN_32662 [Caenorhabditis brenneri]|uniref:Uncharacterized protein n=1 Tax=Caenorhabditis brenneri TaxID=135651 RepID=G0N3U5_CAEBE|nr:hypothetical protein CAEBREN_32662 [Caenorhabditis brenneri]